MLGYAAEEYARSLTEIGEPVALAKSGGWLLIRGLTGEQFRDATGGYPLFSCRNWGGLDDDLQSLPQDIVAVSLVADPSADVAIDSLRKAFPDVCYHYKDHFFADLSRPLTSFVSDHHQRNAKRSFKSASYRTASESCGALGNLDRTLRSTGCSTSNCRTSGIFELLVRKTIAGSGNPSLCCMER